MWTRAFKIAAACVLVTAACASSRDAGFGSDAGPQDASTPPADAASEAAASPDAGSDAAPAREGGPEDAGSDGSSFVPPADMRDRIGVYAWGFDDSSWPGTPDRLNWAASKIAGLGGRTIRVYLGPQDIYHVLPASDGGPFDLATAAASPAYAALFSSASFDTYLLTTYSAGDDAGNWTGGYSASDAATERQQIASLGTYLLSTYPGKTFVILQWEGDNAISSFKSSAAAWTGFTAWIQARASGVSDARAAAGGTTAHLYSGLEFNLLRDPATQAPCDTSQHPCVVSEVVPQVDVDFYSYSSWQSLGPNQSPAQTSMQLQSDLQSALTFARQRDPSIAPSRFVVGEFGAPREQTDLGECAAAARQAAVIGAVTQWGAAFGVFWQIIDNVPSGQPNDFVTGFGLYKASGPASLSAGMFQALYQSQMPTVPTSSCPTISQGGVVDGVNFKSDDIDASTTIAIFGSGFTDAGDLVRVVQTGARWTIATGSPWFYTSASQINATLPGIMGGQNALVYVTNGAGVDSNGQIVPIQ